MRKTAQPGLWDGKYFLLAFAFFTLFTLIFIPQHVLSYLYEGRPVAWKNIAVRVALPSYTWAALTPFIFWLGTRLPIERPNVVRNLAAHLLLSFMVPAIRAISSALLGEVLLRGNFALPSYWRNPSMALSQITNGTGLYMGVLALTHATGYFRKYRDREFRLQQAELHILRMQLHPHFLFNTLNAITALIHDKPKAAEQVLSQLSDLLRLSLGSGKAQEVPLKQELDFLRKYVDIQQTLLQERLKVRWDVRPDALDALVPSMLLQPLVENSIRHGIAPQEEGGTLQLEAVREGQALRLRVRDNGSGFPAGARAARDGIGLSNTRARLQHLYGEAHELTLGDTPGGGATVEIRLPYRETAAGDGHEGARVRRQHPV